MPVCPNCEAEYVEGVKVCADCGYELLPEKEFQEHMINPEDWEVAFTTGEEYNAQMLQANLTGAGIESLILTQKDRNFPAAGDLSLIRLVVKRDDLDTALQIIQDIDSNESDPDENA